MFANFVSNRTTTKLHQAALDYRSAGFSVIPIYGFANPDREKLPILSWKQYQTTPASAEIIDDWFASAEACAALGLVAGRVSGNLVVFDFDVADLATAFAERFSHLADTFTVRSGGRGLPHYYFRVDTDAVISSRAFSGVDLIAEGKYVLAPPSQISGGVYSVEHQAPIRTLSTDELTEIVQFFDSRQILRVENITAKFSDLTQPPTQMLDLPAFYLQHFISSRSRNEALFRTAQHCHNHGIAVESIREQLIKLHIDANPVDPFHTPETPLSRRAEAERTIASAYSYPRNERVTTAIDAPHSALPNSIREHILERDGLAGCGFLRVLEGLFLANFLPGTTITRREIIDQLAPFGVNRRAIDTALKTLGADDQPLISPATEDPNPRFPLDPLHPSADAGRNQQAVFDATTKCGDHATKRAQKPRGRPAVVYRVPGAEEIARHLQLDGPLQPGDPITVEHLANNAVYRQQLTRALIQRRPGQYSQQLLAGRIGVAIRTLQRDTDDGPIEAVPIYEPIERIALENLHALDEYEGLRSTPYCLEDDNGDRYRARKSTANWLIKRGRAVMLVRRVSNFYYDRESLFAQTVSPEQILASARPKTPENELLTDFECRAEAIVLKRRADALAAHIRAQVSADAQPDTPAHQATCPPAEESVKIAKPKKAPAYAFVPPAPPIADDAESAPQNDQIAPEKAPAETPFEAAARRMQTMLERREAREPKTLADYTKRFDNPSLERLADEVRRKTDPTLYSLCKPDAGALSLANARQLIDQFGGACVRAALNVMVWMGNQQKLDTPSGFLIARCRVEWRKRNPDAHPDEVPLYKPFGSPPRSRRARRA